MRIVDPAREDSRYRGDVARGLRAVDIRIGDAYEPGRGYGTAAMRLAPARCFADPAVTAVPLDPLAANTRAHRFYRRLGFRPTGHRRFGEDDCLAHRIERAAYEHEHARW